jgi:small subunit ribosomal protein S1
MDISDALPHPTGAEPSVVPVAPETDTPVAHAPETVQHMDLTEPPSTTDVTVAAELSVDVPPVEAPPLVDAPPIVELPAIVDVPPAEDVPAIVDASAAEPTPAAEAAPAEAAPVAEVAPARPVLTDEQKKAQQDALRARAQEAWQRVIDARESGTVLSGRVTAVVKGGLLVDVGSIRGFLPASQVRAPEGGTLDALVRTKLDLKVIDVDASRRRIVVSNRRAVEEARRNKRSEILRELAVGQTRSATVVRLTDFGAFVDLGGVDGLIPMSELAFERVDKAADVVTVGETLNVVVMRIDENGKKISLSRKNALPDPWRDHADIVRQGVTVEGKVVGKEPRLMVEIAPGVVGSVRENDADPAQYEIGEAIEVSVRFVDRRTRRITLTTLHAADVSTRPPTGSGFAPLGIELGRR